MAGAASQAGDTDSSRVPGLTSGLQGSVNVHRGALLLVPQWQCISSFVFNLLKSKKVDLFDVFNDTFRYQDDMLNFDDHEFEKNISDTCIYPAEQQLNKAN